MVALWILIGGIAVTVAFFLPGHSSELWPNINSAGVALLLYLAALLGAFWRRSDLTLFRRSVVLVVSIIAVAGTVLAWRQMDDQSHWQRDRLNEIGTVISRGIYTATLPDTLLQVLDQYHRQSGRTRKTLGQIYAERYPPGVVGDVWSSMRPSGMPNPPDDIFVTEISDTHIVLVARHPWYKGRSASFANFAGPTGKVQVRATLNEKGIRYVTEN